MSVARTVLLKVSDNQWLRANGTRLPFIRRAVSKFMPGESFDDMLAAAKATAAEGITVGVHAPGRKRQGSRRSRCGGAALSRRHRSHSRAQPRLRAVDQADAARSRYRSRAGLWPPARPRGRVPGGRQLPVDRHGAVAVCRRHADADAAAARGISARRRLPAGLPVSHARGSRGHHLARHRRPAGEGRVQRAGGGGVSEEERCRRELLRAGAGRCSRRGRAPPARARCSARTICS